MTDMSGWNPQIADWMRRGLEWQYIHQTTLRPFEIAARSHVQLPLGAKTFNYPEGVMLQFSSAFDHPTCGIRIESDPEFDTMEDFTVNNMALALSRPDPLVYAIIPPVSPPGFYVVRIGSPWVWKKWLKLYLFNSDSVPHRVIYHGYHLVVLREKRKDLPEEAN